MPEPLGARLASLVARKIGVGREELRAETRLLDDLGADSLDIVELALAVEDEFGVALSDRELNRIVTLSDLEGFLARRT